MTFTGCIDPDDATTWPRSVLDLAEELAAELRRSGEPVTEIGWGPAHREPELLERAGEATFRAFHFTRLLPWEVAHIRSNGLEPLSERLVHRRLREALDQGALDSREYQRLLTSNLFASGDTVNRAGQVCFAAGRAVFQEPMGTDWLLGMWGGEGIYWALADDPDPPRLGMPSVVEARVPLRTPNGQTKVRLLDLLVSHSVGLDAHADVFLPDSLAAENVIDIWQPGHPQFDRYPSLRRV